MTLNEILLVFAFIAALVIPSLLLKRVGQPLNMYTKLASGILLLILVWFFAGEGTLPIKVILTTVVVSSAIKTIKDYIDFARQTKTGAHK